MFVACVAVTLVTVGLTLGAAVADFLPAGFVLANADQVNLPRSWVWWLGALKAAGGVGLLLGLLGWRFLGLVAASGLVAFFVGAVLVHVRARVFRNIAAPGGYLALATASLALLAATG